MHTILIKETTYWGIDIVRAGPKENDPPKDVQDTMNKIVKAKKNGPFPQGLILGTTVFQNGEKKRYYTGETDSATIKKFIPRYFE